MPEILIKIIVAAFLTLVAGRFIIKDRERRKSVDAAFSNSGLVFIISSKLSLLFSHFSSIKNEPMFLLYSWGNSINIILGLVAVLGYFVWFIKTKSTLKNLHTKFLSLSSLVFLTTFFASSLFFSQDTEKAIINVSGIFSMNNIEGEAIENQEEALIILNFWATWCPPCRAEMPELNQFHLAHNQVNFFAVNNINSEKNGIKGVKEFLATKNYSLHVLPDYNNSLTNMFEVISFPTTILLNQSGQILEKHIGVISQEKLETWLKNYQN